MLAAGYDPAWVLVTASLGNWLGGLSSFWLGWLGKWSWIEKYLRIKAEKLEKLHRRIEGKEGWVAFFCWLPGVGDPLAVLLGLLKTRPLPTALWMLLGKALRYAVWGYLTLLGMDLLS